MSTTNCLRSALVLSAALTCASCPSNDPDAPRLVLSSELMLNHYLGDVPNHVDAVTGATMGTGIEATVGIARHPLIVSGGLRFIGSSGDDTTTGDARQQTLFETVISAGMNFPLGEGASMDDADPDAALRVLISVSPYATMLDDENDGFKRGAGYGLSVAYVRKISDTPTSLYWYVGGGLRRLRFYEFVNGGVTTTDDSTLDIKNVSGGVFFNF